MMIIDKEQITKKQYELILEVMQLDPRRTFNSILKELSKKATPQKRTFFLYRLKEEALSKKIKNDEKKKDFSLKDLLDFQKEIIEQFKGNEFSRSDLDLSQYSSFYGDDLVSLLENQIDIIVSLLKNQDAGIQIVDHLNLKNLHIENSVCPYCNIPIKETRNHKLALIFKETTQNLKIEKVCHLKCLLFSNEKE